MRFLAHEGIVGKICLLFGNEEVGGSTPLVSSMKYRIVKPFSALCGVLVLLKIICFGVYLVFIVLKITGFSVPLHGI